MKRTLFILIITALAAVSLNSCQKSTMPAKKEGVRLSI